jgi:hypothetical protein
VTKLEAVAASAKNIQEACPMDCSVMVVAVDRLILAHERGEFHKNTPQIPEFKVGEQLPADAVTFECVAQKKPLTHIVPKEVFGFRWKATESPIIEEDGHVSGVLSIATNLADQDTLLGTAQIIAATAEEMAATTEALGTKAVQLAEELAKVKVGGENVLLKINKTGDILNFVSNVAANSNLLGLNAAIEAARAGEHGRGFAVVAEEIRKMAVNSAQSVSEIARILRDIHDETMAVVKTIVHTSEIGKEQAAATQEITATMGSLTDTAVDIEKIARNL